MSSQFETYPERTCQVIKLQGRFVEDEEHAGFLKNIQDLCDAGESKFVIDLKELKYINSSGINLLVKLVKYLNGKEGKIVFTSVPEKINELLTIIGLNAVFAIQPSINEGLQYLN
ncbi:MAG: anti-anti-sigma factor [Flavobacteriales bacterium]|jgi:anti-sigma B factor antagonist